MRVHFFCRTFLPAILLLLASTRAWSQSSPSTLSNALMRMIASQPGIDTKSPVVATASFDPAVVRPGQRAVYRITLNALQASVRLPDRIPKPDGLKLRATAHGQIFHNVTNMLKPVTTYVFEARADKPGRYVVPAFIAAAYGEPITIPEVELQVTAGPPATHPPPRQLVLECATTNVFVGQQFQVRVLSPSWVSNFVQGLTQVEFNGDGFLANKSAVRQSIESIDHNGRKVPTYIYETTVTAIAAGQMPLSVQAFTAGRQFDGNIIIRGTAIILGGPPEYLLLDSESITLNIRPVPAAGELPGFSGDIGAFECDPPQLSTNTVQVGDPLELTVTIRGTGDLNRLTPPPAPREKGWQTFPPTPAGMVAATANAVSGVAFKYALIPLTDEVRQTPAIPFSFFDPQRETHVDRTIPPMPVVVVATGLPTSLPPPPVQWTDEAAKPAKKRSLSSLATSPGRSAGSFLPLPMRGWFLAAHLLPALGFLGLLLWDQRRRHLALHPEIVRKREAQRRLRRQKRSLKRAAAAGDSPGYARSSVAAMQIACAPHYPAEPRALVCTDVLNVLDPAERDGRAGEVVRRFFASADDSRFAMSPRSPDEVLALKTELDGILSKLEERL